MKNLKNISLLLSIACALPAYSASAELDVEVQKTESESKPTLEVAHNLGVAGSVAVYAVPTALAIGAATLAASNSPGLSLVAAGTTITIPAAFCTYLYKKYKAQLSEEAFKDATFLASAKLAWSSIPLYVAILSWISFEFAKFAGVGTGALIGAVGQKIGLNPIQAGIAATGIALAVPSSFEAHALSEEREKTDSYQTALDFAMAYARNLAFFSFVGLAGCAGAGMIDVKNFIAYGEFSLK